MAEATAPPFPASAGHRFTLIATSNRTVKLIQTVPSTVAFLRAGVNEPVPARMCLFHVWRALANASGRTLGELSYASVDTFENIRVLAPMQRRAMAMAAQGPAPTEEFSP